MNDLSIFSNSHLPIPLIYISLVHFQFMFLIDIHTWYHTWYNEINVSISIISCGDIIFLAAMT